MRIPKSRRIPGQSPRPVHFRYSASGRVFAETAELHRIIIEELNRSLFKPEAVSYHQRVIARLKDEGCEAVVLACTEIPLIINDANSALPTLDSTRLLAGAALRRTVSGGTVR